MKPGSPTIELEGTIKAQTDKAVLFEFEEEDTNDTPTMRREWFPFSQVDQIHHEDPARIVVSQWIYATKSKEWK